METVGLHLEADGADNYLRALTQGAKAEEAIAAAAGGAASAINGLDASLSAADKRAAAAFDELTRLSNENKALSSSADTASDELLGMSKATDKAASSAGDFGDGAGKAGKGAKGLGDESEDAGKKLSVMDKIATGAAERVGHLLTDGFAAAGQAVLSFATDGVSKAGDFEAGMKRFASVTGESLKDSGQSLDDFQKLFIQMGRDLPVSTADVQQAAIEMAKGGIEPATIAAGGLKTALDLAAAGEVGIAESAEILSKQLGVWVDKSADAADKAAFLAQSADLISQAANASTVDVDELALGLSNVGGIAKVAGLSFQETVTTMALLSPGFSSAADAGTSLKTMLTRLQPTTDTAASAMKDLGLLTAEGTSKFYDAEGSFVGMDKAAELLHGSLDGLSEAQKTAKLQAIFGNDAFRAAALLAEQGAKGFGDMGEAMRKAGSAAAQAAAKQQGWNVATDNLMGSLEAFQITVGGATLPLLTTLVNLLSSGINVITDYADVTLKGETALSAIAGVVKDAFVPAIAAASTALLIYGASALAPMLVNLPAMTAVLIYQTSAWIANAAAMALAAAPFVLLAAAVGGVVYAYQSFTSKVEDATTALLESKPWWNESSAAIADYATQTGKAKDALTPYAQGVTALREEIQREVEDLGKREAAGHLSDAQMQAELATIQAHRDGLVIATAAYTEQEQAIIKASAATMTATSEAGKLTGSTAELSTQVSLTAGDIETLGKKIAETYQKGQEAVQGYATNQSEFLAGVEQRQADHAEKIAELEAKKQQATTDEQKQGIDEQIRAVNQSYADQETAAAGSYARQQAQQNAHLGQMLIDYTVAQASLGNISKEKAAEITGALEKEYGLQESSVASTFLHMAGSIDTFAASSGKSVDTLTADLKDQQQQAADTQKGMDDYAKTYEAKAVNNFLDAKLDAEAYTRSLENVPKEVQTEFIITKKTIETYEKHAARDDPEGKATGGPIEAMTPYLVGERGPELIMPGVDSTVLTASETRRALSMPPTGGGGSSGGRTVNLFVDARGSSLSMADIQRGVQAGLRAEGNSADVQIRTGAF